MTSTISMQRSIIWVKIRPERWRFHIHFFIRSSHDFYIFTVLTIIATAITTTATYFPLHVDSTSWRFVLNLMLMAFLTGVYWSDIDLFTSFNQFCRFSFPYFPIFQIVDMPVLRVSSKSLEMYSSARRWRQHNLRCVFRRWRRDCKRL